MNSVVKLFAETTVQRQQQHTPEMKYQQINNNEKESVMSPVKIQVLSSDDEEDVKNSPSKLLKTTTEGGNNKNNSGHEDKCVQTDVKWVQQMIEKIVSSRMKVFAEAVRNEDNLDRKLSPLLIKLKQENAELHKKALYLKARLERCEKNNLKRTFDEVVCGPPVKRSVPETCSTATVLPTATIPPLVTSKQSPKNQQNILQKTPKNHQMTLPKGNLAQSARLPLQQQPIRPQQYHLIPANVSYPQRFIVPATMNVQRAQQSTPVYCYPPAERLMFIENASVNQGGGYNVSTQVVAANQGLRMASHPNDNRTAIQKNIYNSTFRAVSCVSGMRSYHPTLTNSVRPNILKTGAQTAFTNLRGNITRPGDRGHVYSQSETIASPTKKTVNAVDNQTQPPNQTVPNIALPFNSLPKLKTSISATGTGIILTWDYETPGDNPDKYKVECYQLFAHQAKNHTARTRPTSEVKDWKKIGVVNALPLPMACTLTQFATGNVYYFAVVAVDIHGREGEMSNKCVIRLNLNP